MAYKVSKSTQVPSNCCAWFHTMQADVAQHSPKVMMFQLCNTLETVLQAVQCSGCGANHIISVWFSLCIGADQEPQYLHR